MARIAPRQKQEEVIEGSTVLAVDSSETATMTDLGTLGLTGLQFSQGVTGGRDGGGSPGSVQPPQYAPMCTAVVHDPAFYENVQPNGAWVGDVRDNVDDAQFDVSGHDDLRAFLCIQIGTNLIGPYTPGSPA